MNWPWGLEDKNSRRRVILLVTVFVIGALLFAIYPVSPVRHLIVICGFGIYVISRWVWPLDTRHDHTDGKDSTAE